MSATEPTKYLCRCLSEAKGGLFQELLSQETPQRRPEHATFISPAVELGTALCSCIVTVSSEDVPLEVLCVCTDTHTHTEAETVVRIICESSGQLIKTEELKGVFNF